MEQTGIAAPDAALRSVTMNPKASVRNHYRSDESTVPNHHGGKAFHALVPSALIVASLAGLISLAPTAHADPDPISVAAYLHTLNVLHVPYDNAGRMVDIGSNVCQQARGGTDFDAIYPTVASNGFASAQAGQIMGAAVGTFCPDMEAPFDRWTNT